MHVAASGRLISEPKSIETKSGLPMATAMMAIKVEKRGADDVPDPVVSLTCFGEHAERLLAVKKFDTIAVSGSWQSQLWNDETRHSIVVDSVSSARAAADQARRRHAAASMKGKEEAQRLRASQAVQGPAGDGFEDREIGF